MLLRRIYIMALEHPGSGFFGILGQIGKTPPSLRDLDLFVCGYLQCLNDIKAQPISGSWGDFVDWLKAQDYYPPQGWAARIIEETGDGEAAFSRFKELLFAYLESELPQWFIEFNRSEQPSFWFRFKVEGTDYSNARTVPTRLDIRIEKHIRLALENTG